MNRIVDNRLIKRSKNERRIARKDVGENHLSIGRNTGPLRPIAEKAQI